MRAGWIAAAALALAVPLAAQQVPPPPVALTPDEAALKAHVAFLASDALRGREAGTSDYAVAAEYVAARMLAVGLTPAGANGGWFQPVPLVVSRAAGEPRATLSVAGKPVPFVFGTDFTLRGVSTRATVDVAAPVVFAGYGTLDPANGRDDYRGLDVTGKIVAVLYNGPKVAESDVSAHLGSRVERARVAAAKGAVGIVYIESTGINKVYPFAAMARNWRGSAMTWTRPDGSTPDGGAPSLGVISFAGAEKLFAGSTMRWADVLAADAAGTAVPTGALAATLSVSARYDLERLSSDNVVGMIPGSDPKLKSEYVVLSAHLDHIGVTDPVAGDAINNGALDNAMGIAAMLEAARSFQTSGKRPRRSVIFIAVTAEEKGLIGSDYFATNPTVPKGSIVANVNLDMPILTYKFVDLVAFGADRSGIGPVVARVAKANGVALVPDPSPEEASFVRTDHYSFVKAGIPAVSLDIGPGGPGAAATRDFLDKHYHQPSDDMTLPIDWTAARLFVKINYEIARDLADADARPLWNRGDFFGALYGGPMAK